MAIVLLLSHGFAGFGDFTFIKNTATCVHETSPDKEIIIVSEPKGVALFRDLTVNGALNATVLTITEYNKKIERAEIHVELFIEGPVFNIAQHTSGAQMARIDHLPGARIEKTEQIKIPPQTPALLLPEYGSNEKTERELKEVIRLLEEQGITDIQVLRSGLRDYMREEGIFQNTALKPTAPKETPTLKAAPADKKLIDLIYEGEDITSLLAAKDLSLEYSYSNAEQFIIVHAAWAKEKNKHQLILGLGHGSKESQLLKHLPVLKEQFSEITYIHFEKEEKKVLFSDPESSLPTYTFIHAVKIKHETMLHLIQVSGPIMGGTGDQSLSEGLSALKIVAYECLEHKVTLAKGLNQLLRTHFPAGGFFKEFVHRTKRGKPNQLSASAIRFLSSPDLITQYQKTISTLLERYDLFKAIAQVIKTHERPAPRGRSSSILKEDEDEPKSMPLAQCGELLTKRTAKSSPFFTLMKPSFTIDEFKEIEEEPTDEDLARLNTNL